MEESTEEESEKWEEKGRSPKRRRTSEGRVLSPSPRSPPLILDSPDIVDTTRDEGDTTREERGTTGGDTESAETGGQQ